MKTHPIFTSIFLFALLLASCGPNLASPSPTEAESTITPRNPTPSALVPTAGVAQGPYTPMIKSLADQLGIPTEEISVFSSEEAMWPDSCLGIQYPGMMCADVIVPGFRILLETPNGIYEFRTPEETSKFVMTPPEQMKEAFSMFIRWQRSGGIAGICQRLTILAAGNYRLVDCTTQKTISQGSLPAKNFQYLETLNQKWGAFLWEVTLPAGSADQFLDNYRFTGSGTKQPSPDDQQSLNEYLAQMVTFLSNP